MTEAKKIYLKKKYPDVPEEELKVALEIEEKLGLDFTLNHLVIFARKDRNRGTTNYTVYITRDGLLYLMHQMGKPWSLRMEHPVRKENPYTGKDDVWLEGEVAVFDPETGQTQAYRGGVWLSEYKANFGSWKTHPASMHFKVVEVFLYRRATNVAITPIEEMDRVIEMELGGGSQPDAQPKKPKSRPKKDGKITPGTIKKIEAIAKAAGFGDKFAEETMRFAAGILNLGSPPKSINELTEEEGTIIADAMKKTFLGKNKQAGGDQGVEPGNKTSEKITKGTLRKIEALLKAAGYTPETADKARERIAEILGLESAPKSISDLTEAQGATLVEKIKEGMLAQAEKEFMEESAKENKQKPEGEGSLDEEFPPPEAFE